MNTTLERCPHCGAVKPQPAKPLTEEEISTRRKYTTDRIMASGAVLKNGTAYVRFPGRWGLPVIYEFSRKRNRWEWVGIGRGEYYAYLNLQFKTN